MREHFAKGAFDVGIFTENLDRLRPFYDSLSGLEYDELLPVGGGIHQHRYRAGESIFKLNASRDPLTDAPPSGLRTVVVRSGDAAALSLDDPDGNRLRSEPGETAALGLEIVSSDPERLAAFYRDALRLGGADAAAVLGASRIDFVEGPSPAGESPLRAPGLRYLTLQVHDVAEAHRQALVRGASEGVPPRTLGDVASISFVRDPDGNWIELSQRRSLTGDLEIRTDQGDRR